MDDKKSKMRMKLLVKTLGNIKGRHTELVTVYIPAGSNIHETVSQLRTEQGTADNIKSKSVRKNVTTSLEKIMRHLQLYKKTPKNGLAVFAGNVSERDGAADIQMWSIEPYEPFKTKLYWCDQKFVLDPIEEMVREKDINGIINLDKSEADIAILRGKKIEPIAHFESIVPGKTRAGGQSSARFSRIREGLLNDWLKKIGEASNKLFSEHKEVISILLSGPGPIKEMFLKGDFLHTDIKKKIVGTVDTSYTGEFGLHETLERGGELLKSGEVIKEKKILQRFFNELQKTNGLVTYGINEVIEAIKKGAVDKVIISEDIDIEHVEYECGCGLTRKFVRIKDKNSQKCKTCNKIKKILGEMEIIEAIEELSKNYSTEVEVVSSDTREGEQFLQLGGIAAFLRYNI